MEHVDICKEAIRLEKLFQDTIADDCDFSDDEKYKNICEIYNFMKNHTENLEQLSGDNGKRSIFIIGPTGSGKSTLINYLFKEDNLLVSEYGKIYAKDPVADIGEGTTGSTTLFWNTWKHSDMGVFIDCAGDFDSRGVLTEVIQTKIKTSVANNVKSSKMIFVFPQASLSAEGAYGKIFAEALDKNAKFFKDIDYFKNNILIVVSHANRNFKTPEIIDTLLNYVLKQSSLSMYTEAVKHVLDKQNIVTFCKPSEEASSGSLYKPPSWNVDERMLIINKISALDFIAIPENNFNVSSSPEIKRQMDKALTIVKKKAVQILTDAVKETVTPKLTVYATELKPFADFLKQLITTKISADLQQYIKYLNYNNFLIAFPDPEVINKLTDELNYIEPFTNDKCNSNTFKVNKYDWNHLTGIPSLLHNIQEEVIAIINNSSGAELFTKFDSYNNLIVKGGFSDSASVKSLFEKLHNKHKEKCNIELLKHDSSSKYYDDAQEREFDYMDTQEYTKPVYLTESEPYTDTKTVEKDVPYTETEYYYDEESAPVRNAVTNILSLGLASLFKGKALTDTVRRSREVTRYQRILETKEVTDYKNVIKTKEVTEHRDKPVYKLVTKRHFNQSKYNEDIKETDDSIAKLRKDIMEMLAKMKLDNQNIEATLSKDVLSKVKCNMYTSKSQEQNQFTTPFKDLYEQWKFLEYQALFLNKPDMSLDINNMEQLLG